jgi:hypothetical protein
MKTLHCLGLFLLLAFAGTSCKKGEPDTPQVPAEVGVGIFTNEGAQLTATDLQGGAFVQHAGGQEYAYMVVNGKPGHLVGYDMAANKVVADLPLTGADGSIALAASTDNWLYIGGSNAHLYRTRPGSLQLEDLGVVLPGQTTISTLVAGKDGEVFGGTYPGCRIFRYHPADGFSDAGKGAVVPGESYVRSVVYQAKADKVFAGIGAHARLVELDPRSGTKRELLPQQYWDQEFIYSLGLAAGVDGGDRLLAWLTSADSRQTLVYNLTSGLIEQVIGTIDANSAIRSLSGNLVYYTANSKLYSHDLSVPTRAPTPIADCYEAKDMRWGQDGKLHILTRYGQVRRYDPASGSIATIKFEVSPQPYNIQTLVTGPDGRIWSSGYLNGGNAAYDPVSRKVTSYDGLGQAEGMTVQGKNIYFGIYPAARFYVYDTQKPWSVAQNNPKLIGQVAGQDRPFGGASVEDQGKMFFGTVPGYGKLGGALVEYDAATGVLQSHLNVIPNQSVVSLAYVNGQVWGGTTVSGGLGIAPSAREAKFFAWDVLTKSKVFEIAPVPGAWAITCLIKGPEGKIWGMADGTIFIFDPVKKEVTLRHKLYEIPGTPTHIWRNAFMVLHPSGQVYLTANGEFFRVNPVTMQVTSLKRGLGLLAMDKQGRLYTRDAENLWRYKP